MASPEDFAAAVVTVTSGIAILNTVPDVPVSNFEARLAAFDRLKELIRAVEVFAPGTAKHIEDASRSALAARRG